MNMPTFSAERSLYKSGVYRTGTSGIPPTLPSSVMPQAFRGRIGGFGRLGTLEPRSPECSRCVFTCHEVSCGPNCREERCEDVCQSVPCGPA
jgi:hypothetical protein